MLSLGFMYNSLHILGEFHAEMYSKRNVIVYVLSMGFMQECILKGKYYYSYILLMGFV